MTTAEHALAVWTDFGGVLTPPVHETFQSFQERFGVPTHALKEAMAEVGRGYGTDSMGPLDIPLVDEPTWAKQVEEVLADQYGLVADLSDFGERWFDGRPPNHQWVDYLRSVRDRGVFVGMLSNMPPAWERQWRRMVPEALFDGIVVSHKAGSRKPEPEIFAAAQALAGRPASRCLLVDDLAVNVAGALAAGWQAVLFTDADAVGKQIDDLLGEKIGEPA